MNQVTDKNYFIIEIHDDKTFSLSKTTKRPEQKQLALETQIKIEKILTENLKYSPKESDKNYQTIINNDFLPFFKEKSTEILQKYKQSALKSNWVFNQLFSNEEKVNEIYLRIQKLTDPLPDQIIQNEFFKHLNKKDLASVRSSSRHLKTLADSFLLERAQKFGFFERDSEKATEYLKNLYNDLYYCYKNNLIPKEHLSYIEKRALLINYQSFDEEGTLNKLKNNLSSKDFFKIFNAKQNWLGISNRTLTKKQGAFIQFLISIEKEKDFSHYTKEVREMRKQSVGNALFCSNELLNFLLESGVDPNETPPTKFPNLISAICANNLKGLKLLLDYGAKKDITTSKGRSLLHMCFKQNQPVNPKDREEIMIYLLKIGIDPNIQDQNGNTALHLACEIGVQCVGDVEVIENRKKILKHLLEKGANPNIQNNLGDTPLHIATTVIDVKERIIPNQKKEFLNILLEYEADPTMLNNLGMSPRLIETFWDYFD